MRNGHEVREIGVLLGTVTLLLQHQFLSQLYQSGCPALLIKPVVSEYPIEIDFTVVSSASSPPGCPLAQSPAAYLFVMDFSHLRLSCSSLQPQSESVEIEASFTY